MRSSQLLLFVALSLIACSQQFPQGANLYTYYCANCHMDDGTGLAKLIPPLKDADFLGVNRDQVPCLIRNGMQKPLVVNGITYEEPMPAYPRLSAVEISNIINYIHTSWGNDLPLTNPAEVKEALTECPQ